MTIQTDTESYFWTPFCLFILAVPLFGHMGVKHAVSSGCSGCSYFVLALFVSTLLKCCACECVTQMTRCYYASPVFLPLSDVLCLSLPPPTPPLQIAFSQHSNFMDLVQFFVTFFRWVFGYVCLCALVCPPPHMMIDNRLEADVALYWPDLLTFSVWPS